MPHAHCTPGLDGRIQRDPNLLAATITQQQQLTAKPHFTHISSLRTLIDNKIKFKELIKKCDTW